MDYTMVPVLDVTYDPNGFAIHVSLFALILVWGTIIGIAAMIGYAILR